MAGRASSDGRSPLETAALAGIGALALAADRVEDLADELARRLGIAPAEVRSALAETLESWRRELQHAGESAEDLRARIVADLGLVTRDTADELELRLAQLEHRLRLLERRSTRSE